MEVLGKTGGALGKAGRKLLDLCKSLYAFAEKLFVYGVQKSLWFVTFIMVALILSYVWYKAAKPVYSSIMVAQVNVLDNAFAIDFVNGLGRSATQPAEWQKIFNLPDTVLAQQISSVGAYWGIDYTMDGAMDMVDFNNKFSRPQKDSVYFRIPDKFYVRAMVYDREVLPYITKGIVEKFSSNQFVRQQNELRKAQLKERIVELSYQIRLLDSLQRYEYFIKPSKSSKADKSNMVAQTQGQMMIFTEKDQRLYHGDILSLHNERLSLEHQLQRSEPVTVLQDIDVAPSMETTYMSLAKPMAIYAFLLAIVCALVWDNRRWWMDKIFHSQKK